MPSSLMEDFRGGFDAASMGGVLPPCPYYATSNAADAWHTGAAYRRDFGRRISTALLPEAVTHGRGYLVNVIAKEDKPQGRKARLRKLVYRVNYDNGAARASLISEGN